MHKPDHPSTVPVMPAISASEGNEGYFSEGNPGAAQKATFVTGDFLNDLLQNLEEISSRVGIVWTKGRRQDLADSLERMAARVAPSAIEGRLEYVSPTVVRLARSVYLPAFGSVVAAAIRGRLLISIADIDFDVTLHLASGEAEVASTWYYLYLQHTPGSQTVAPRISASPPVRDAGAGNVGYHPTHTSWRYVGAVYNDAAGNFLPFHRVGMGQTVLREGGTFLHDATELGTAAPSSFQLLTITGDIPATATAALCVGYIQADDYRMLLGHAARAGTPVARPIYGVGVGSPGQPEVHARMTSHAWIPVPEGDAKAIAWGMAQDTPNASVQDNAIDVVGFYDPFGVR